MPRDYKSAVQKIMPRDSPQQKENKPNIKMMARISHALGITYADNVSPNGWLLYSKCFFSAAESV